jgi:hypothetical protein
MKLGTTIVTLIAALIVGAFLGWGVAAIAGEGNEGQSGGTGIGCAVGFVVGLVVVLLNRKSSPPASLTR